MTATASAPGPAALGQREVALVTQVAHAMARRLWNRPDPSDLESLGLMVLCDAAKQHDPSRTAFMPYLVERLRWAMVSDARQSARRERILGEVLRAGRSAGAIKNEESESTEEESTEHADPEGTAERALVRAKLNAALASLDDETRMVLVSHYFGGQNLEGVASELGRSKATVTRIHHAGLRQLAELLGDVRASAPSPSLSRQPSNQRRAPE